ncbi:hypothetical protein [Actinoplanes ianthinogenes]|nr:hypothetical protein [Actinoplanes ianthinogenes]
MFARMQTVAARPQDDSLVERVTELVSGHPGFAGLILLEDTAGGGAMVTLWQSREDAELASERSRAHGPRPVTLLSDDIYEVADDITGAATGAPGAALVGYFDGPLTPARVVAATRAGRDRVGPVLKRLPTLLRTLILWDPDDRRFAVIHLATSPAGLDAVVTAVTSTELLPGEDPALLTGPDRVHRHAVRTYLVPDRGPFPDAGRGPA